MCDNEPECADGSDESEELCQNTGKCGGMFSSSNGLLTSPSYPMNYPNNKECIYTLSGPTDMIFNLTFVMFDLYDRHYFDFLEIRDGGSNDSELIGKFTYETYVPSSVQTSRNQVWLR